MNSKSLQSMFKPLPSRRAFEEIAHQIKEGINTGLLKPGDKLPPERELARQFNAGRTAVREALRVLEDSGYIYIVKGGSGGSFIKAPDPADAVKSLADFASRGNITLDQITQARMAVEPYCLEILVQKGRGGRLAELKANIQETEKWLMQGVLPNYTQVGFHVLLARATENPLLETFLSTLMTLTAGFFGKGDPDLAFSYQDLQSHKAIINAIETKDIATAQRLLRTHIVDSRAFINKVMTRQEAPEEES